MAQSLHHSQIPGSASGHTYANAIHIAGNNIYVAGRQSGSAKIWRNGVGQFVSGHAFWSVSNNVADIFVSGSNVYAVGTAVSNAGHRLPTLWRNGVAEHLCVVSRDFGARAIFISGNDVYIAGTMQNAEGVYVSTLWRNGVAQHLGVGIGRADDVYVSSSTVYVVGRDNDYATLWRNGVAQRLSNNISWAFGLFVLNDNVYIVGRERNAEGIDVATLWINGVPQRLSNEQSNAGAVFVVYR